MCSNHVTMCAREMLWDQCALSGAVQPCNLQFMPQPHHSGSWPRVVDPLRRQVLLFDRAQC